MDWTEMEKIELGRQIDTFLQSLTMTTKDLALRQQMLQDLQQVFSFGKIHPFGSFVTGIGNRKSDLDIYFEDQRIKNNSEDLIDEIVEILQKAKIQRFTSRGHAFNKASKYCDKVGVLRDARVPLLRFKPLGCNKIRVDLSFKDTMACHASRAVGFLFTLSPIARPLAIVMREWARSQGLLMCSGFKSYAICLLVIVLLMRKKKLPSFHFLQSLVPPKFVSSSSDERSTQWNVNFCDHLDTVHREMEKQGISTSPMTIERSSDLLSWISDMFDLMASLKTHKIRSSTGDLAPKETYSEECKEKMFLYDPFVLDENIMEFCKKSGEIEEAITRTVSKIRGHSKTRPFLFPQLFDPKFDGDEDYSGSNGGVEVIPIKNFDSYERLQKVTGWSLRFIHNAKNPKSRKGETFLSPVELEDAFKLLLKLSQIPVQNQSQIVSLEDESKNDNNNVSRYFEDENGLFKVKLDADPQATSLFVLNDQSKFSNLLVLHLHLKHGHAKAVEVARILCQNFYVTKTKKFVKLVISQLCSNCGLKQKSFY